ncbi:MAG: hypothetical protein WCI72_01885 [archaeon]
MAEEAVQSNSNKKIVIIILAVVIILAVLGIAFKFIFVKEGVTNYPSSQNITVGGMINACEQGCKNAKLSSSDETACITACRNTQGTSTTEGTNDLTMTEIQQKAKENCINLCNSQTVPAEYKTSCLANCNNTQPNN